MFFLAECQYFLGELEEAGKRYARFLEGGSPGGRSAEGEGASAAWAETARYRLARIALRQGRPGAALEALSRLEKGFPEGRFRREVPALRGEALFALKRFGDSAAAWREALRAVPADGAERQSLAFNLAQAAQEAGDVGRGARGLAAGPGRAGPRPES